MALITDPDNLNQGVEVTISTGAKTIKLNIAGNLSSDGVTGQCVFSFLKEEWRNDSTLNKFPFPMEQVTTKQFELIGGWDWADDATRYLIRSAGWAVKNTSGVIIEEWAGVISLGAIGSSDQVYFQQESNGAAVNFQLTGAVNQAVKIYGDASRGNINYRSYLKVFVRTQGKTYSQSQLSEIGVTTMTYEVYSFALTNQTDLKVVANDATIVGSAPYTGMSITWYAADQARSIGGTNYNFKVIINGNNGTAEQIYSFVQWALRQNSDIDAGAGTKTGKLADSLLRFTGDALTTLLQTEGGVYIDNFNNADINRLTFIDNTGTGRTFPFTAALTLEFNSNLVADTAAKYWVYFTNDDAGDNTGRDFGTANAIVVNNASGVAMTGDVSGASSVSLTFAYDANTQRGAASAGVDAPITVVAIGLNTAQYVVATGTIERSTANKVSLVAALERVYVNA